MEEKNRNNKSGFLVLILVVLILFIAVGYAAWTKVYNGEKENSIDTATLILTLDESNSNEIALLNTVPVSDTKGLTFRPYTFKLKNSGTIAAKYRLRIINYEKGYTNDGCSRLDWSNIRYSFKKNNEVATIGNLGEINGVLNIGEIDALETNTYSLILWIKSDATNEVMNQHFHGMIKVDAIQSDQELDD